MENTLSFLTRDGRSALANAKRIAKKNHRSLIDSDMLLLGILQLPDSQAESALEALHVKTDHLKTRLAASIKLDSRQNEMQPETGIQLGKFSFTANSAAILTEAHAETQLQGVDSIDARALVSGVLRCPQSKACQILAQYGVYLEPFRKVADIKGTPTKNLPRFQMPSVSASGVYFGVSIVFIGVVLLTALAGYFTYTGIVNPEITMFVFVIGGWIISLSLHEFGHAVVAYWGGDKSVVDKGYLTLNPLKYTHPFLSIFMPLLFLVMGGIGLPGGAVYINPMAIRTPAKRSLTAAAGPIASGICALVLILPFIFIRWSGYETILFHFEFWAGLAFLAFLQITAIAINILPIPGLDGFGILYPFLPPEIAYKADLIRPFGFFILFGLLFLDTPIRDMFWQEIWGIVVRISPILAQLADMGLQMFRLW